jgi:hypothetical protein
MKTAVKTCTRPRNAEQWMLHVVGRALQRWFGRLLHGAWWREHWGTSHVRSLSSAKRRPVGPRNASSCSKSRQPLLPAGFSRCEQRLERRTHQRTSSHRSMRRRHRLPVGPSRSATRANTRWQTLQACAGPNLSLRLNSAATRNKRVTRVNRVTNACQTRSDCVPNACQTRSKRVTKASAAQGHRNRPNREAHSP